jgi:hypothetical protein
MAWCRLLLYQFLHLAITEICLASSLEFVARTHSVTVTRLYYRSKGKFVTVHAIKASGGIRGIAPLIFYLDTRWRRVVRFMPHPLYPSGKSSLHPIHMTLDRLRGLFGLSEGKVSIFTQACCDQCNDHNRKTSGLAVRTFFFFTKVRPLMPRKHRSLKAYCAP